MLIDGLLVFDGVGAFIDMLGRAGPEGKLLACDYFSFFPQTTVLPVELSFGGKCWYSYVLLVARTKFLRLTRTAVPVRVLATAAIVRAVYVQADGFVLCGKYTCRKVRSTGEAVYRTLYRVRSFNRTFK